MPRASNILGFVDGVQRGRLHGWALDRDNLGCRLLVVVTVAKHHPIVVIADRYRADIQQSGYGDGHYGFSVPIAPDPREVISVHVPSGQSFVPLLHVKKARGFADTRTAEVGSQRLQVDDVKRQGHVSGWAWNRERPTYRSVLQLLLDNSVRQTRRATLYREELVAEGCDGYHGFHFALPAGFSGRLALRDITVGQTFKIRRCGILCA